MCAALLALADTGCGGAGPTGPCYTLDGSQGAGLVECYYLTETNGQTCAALKQMDGHCPSSDVGCCVHSDGSAVCYSQDPSGLYQSECAAPDRWQTTPP